MDFLHTHPGEERKLGVESGHFIVDAEDWAQAKKLEQEKQHLLSLIIREWPGGGWVAALPETGRTFPGCQEIESGQYYFGNRADAVNAVCKGGIQ
jgi:hypothetical protein